jgi:tyrosine-protein kinase Etk/Wzc
MAKLDEAKDFPLIQVLDKAIPPERKSKPKRSVIVIMATLAAFLISIFWAFIRESITRAEEQPEQAERLKNLRSALKLRIKD